MTYRIYYLDDEDDLVNLFKTFIDDNDMEVTTFTDANDAIICCKTAPPDLMFIDYRLADTTGDKVASVLNANINKILLTGELDRDEDPLFEQVIKKPFRLSDIKKIIDKKLELTNTNKMSREV